MSFHNGVDVQATCYLITMPTVSGAGQFPDLSGLKEHGRVVTLVSHGENPLFRPRKCVQLIQRRLETFDVNKDFLVTAGGGMLAAVLVGWVLRDRGISRFRWLSYQRYAEGDRPAGTYRALWMDLTQLTLEDAEEDMAHGK